MPGSGDPPADAKDDARKAMQARLLAAEKASGLTRAQISEKTGVGRNTLGPIMTGRHVTGSAGRKVLALLGVELED